MLPLFEGVMVDYL